jgi:hypothetical protein
VDYLFEFKECGILEKEVSILHVSTPNELKERLEKDNSLKDEALFLCDLELIGHKENGLDLIEKYKLKKAILVTSHYEEDKVRSKCEKLNVTLIPKMLAGLVPINIKKTTNKIDAILIDDDKFIRMDWESYAKENNIKLLTFSSTKEFKEYQSDLDKSVDVYIDRQLGDDEPKGEDFAKKLHDNGFKNIYMATGHNAEMFSSFTFLKGVIGKWPFGQQENDDF